MTDLDAALLTAFVTALPLGIIFGIVWYLTREQDA